MEISQFLTNARDTNKEIRIMGEKKLEESALADFGQFLIVCAKELADDQKNKLNRQLAATLIKNMLLFMPKFVGKYEMLDQNLKSDIKNQVLSTLASADLDVRKGAALCVAGIYKLEQKKNEWPELIDILVQTCANENQNFQTAAIMTLGYISQEINAVDFKVEDVDKILSALIGLLSNANLAFEVAKTSNIAFVNYICFAKKNFEKQVK